MSLSDTHARINNAVRSRRCAWGTRGIDEFRPAGRPGVLRLVLDNLVGLVRGLQFQVTELRLVCQHYAQAMASFKEIQLILYVLMWP
jgi:hypothetical protein